MSASRACLSWRGIQASVRHPSLREIIHNDPFEHSAVQSEFASQDACFFCLGVSSVGMSEGEYYHLTYDLTLAAAASMAAVTSERLTFCYVSGEGTDSTERGSSARGPHERQDGELSAAAAIQSGLYVSSRVHPAAKRHPMFPETCWNQALYSIVGPFYLMSRLAAPRHVTTTEYLGLLIIQVAASGICKNRFRRPATSIDCRRFGEISRLVHTARVSISIVDVSVLYRAFIRNFEQLGSLFGRELANKMNVQLNAIEHSLFGFAIGAIRRVYLGVPQIDSNFLERPSLPPSVHPHRHRSAGSQGS